jgi:hypothetical protein
MALDVAPVPERQPVRAKAATLHLLNCFELRRCEGVVKLQPSPQRLLAFLAVHNRPLHRSFVAGNLWPDFTQDHANAALRTALWRLRGPTCRVVTATTSHLGLTGDLAVDLWEATERAQRAVDHRAERGEAVELCQTGDLLPDWYEDWLVIERSRCSGTLCGRDRGRARRHRGRAVARERASRTHQRPSRRRQRVGGPAAVRNVPMSAVARLGPRALG